jgi:hypothetical protein
MRDETVTPPKMDGETLPKKQEPRKIAAFRDGETVTPNDF